MERYKEHRLGLAILIILIMIPFAFGLAENLLENGDFSELDGEGYPDYWYTDAYILEPGYTVFSVGKDTKTNSGTIEIKNIGSNDARYAQIVEVEPDTLYRLSGDIMAEDVEGGHGANLSIEGVSVINYTIPTANGYTLIITERPDRNRT